MELSIKSRIDRVEKAMKPDYSRCHLLAFVNDSNPEESKYMIWDGVPGSGNKIVSKEQWEEAAQKLPDNRTVQIIRDDI